MQYQLNNELDWQKFRVRVSALKARGAVIELTEKAFRTRNQNNYLHLLIGVVAMETGNTLAYTKEWYFKRLVNSAIFVVEKEDKYMGKIAELRSSAEVSKEEMSEAIDRFKRWSNEQGIYMPEAGDESLLREIEVEMGRYNKYL